MPAPPLVSVSDARRRARRILPRVVFDYIDGAADDEITMAENEAAYRDIVFRPRMAVEMDEADLSTTVLGTPLDLPVILAPCGLVRLMHPDGAAGAARAAHRRGTVSILSTVAGVALETLAGLPGHRWYQLYAAGGRPEAATIIERAGAAGYEALVVTVDTPALGNRERDIRNGVTPPLRMNAHTALTLGPQILVRPQWAARMLRDSLTMVGGGVGGGDGGGAAGGRRRRGGSAGRGGGSGEAAAAAAGPDGVQATSGVGAAGAVAMLASPFTWSDIAWIRDRWSLPLLVKGVLSGDDAQHAADAGADAVIVSNHGGRQLDGAPATVRVLPEVVDRVGARIPVLVDGGVRRGGDVVKAVALGATAVCIGRPYLYALAVAGESGVEQVLTNLATEMRRTMRLLGCASVAELDRSWLDADLSRGLHF